MISVGIEGKQEILRGKLHNFFFLSIIGLLHLSGRAPDNNGLAGDTEGLFFKLLYFFGNKVLAPKLGLRGNEFRTNGS